MGQPKKVEVTIPFTQAQACQVIHAFLETRTTNQIDRFIMDLMAKYPEPHKTFKYTTRILDMSRAGVLKEEHNG